MLPGGAITGKDFGNFHLLQPLVIAFDQVTGLVLPSDMNLAADKTDTLSVTETTALHTATVTSGVTLADFNHALCDAAQYNDLSPADYFLGLEIPDVDGAETALEADAK